MAKPVKPVTNQGGQAPRGKKASPAPETSRGKEEIPEAKSGKPTQPLCWPSRSLEGTLGSGKRKRWGDPCTEQQPVKLRRIGDKIDFSSQQSGVKTPIQITNSAGTFKVPSPSDSDWSDSDEEEWGFKVPLPSDSDEEVHGFKVQLPSDSDWSDSDWSDSDWSNSDEEVQEFKVPLPSDSDWGSGDEDDENVSPAVNAVDNYGPTSGQNLHSYEEWSKQATPAVVAALGGMEVDPQTAGDAFERGLDKFNASGYNFKSIPDNLQPFTPLKQYGISSRVEAHLDSQWNEEDRLDAVTEFDGAFKSFQEDEAAVAATAT